jgi:hypothetical protein
MKVRYTILLLLICNCLFLSAVQRNLVIVEIGTGT